MPASVMRRTSLTTGVSDEAISRPVASGNCLAGAASGGRGRIGVSARSSCGKSGVQRSAEPSGADPPHCSSALGMAASAPAGACSSQAVR